MHELCRTALTSTTRAADSDAQHDQDQDQDLPRRARTSRNNHNHNPKPDHNHTERRTRTRRATDEHPMTGQGQDHEEDLTEAHLQYQQDRPRASGTSGGSGTLRVPDWDGGEGAGERVVGA